MDALMMPTAANFQDESTGKMAEVLSFPVQAVDILGKQQDMAEQVAKLDQKVEHLMETLIKTQGVCNWFAMQLCVAIFSLHNIYLPNT